MPVNDKLLRVAVGTTYPGNWRQQFVEALERKRAAGYPLSYDVVDIERHDWINALEPYDVVLWKPECMGLANAAAFKEKVYFMERHMGKVVVPNFNSVWHFESKNAQSYLFALDGVRTPRTTVCFRAEDAQRQLETAAMPLVFKRSHGAASKQVRLVKDAREAEPWLRGAFCGNEYKEARMRQGGSRLATALRLLGKRWFWSFLWRHLLDKEPLGNVYWQEFVPDNPADMKIIVIGDRYVYGYWRNNRPGDFRASGGGNLDFQRPIPQEVIQYCLDLNRRWDVDSMGYDILLRHSEPIVIEMSHAYYDTYPQRSSGYHERQADGTLAFVEGHVWPEQLWVEWALHRGEQRLSGKADSNP